MHSMSLPGKLDDKQLSSDGRLSPKDTRTASTSDLETYMNQEPNNQLLNNDSAGEKLRESGPSSDFQSLVEFHKMLTSSPGSAAMLESQLKKVETQMHLANMHMSAASRLCTTGLPVITTTGGNVCQVCRKQFARWEQLKRHLITHTDYRPYECKICGKKFQLQNKMQRHELIHSGIKPYQCPLCSVKVSRKEHLKRHMLVHSEAKPFRCSMCDHSARRLDSMHSHVKQKHGEVGATVVSLFKDPDYLESIEALTKSLEQGIQGPLPNMPNVILPGMQPMKKSKKKGSKKRKRSNPMQVESFTQTDMKGDNGSMPSTSGGAIHRANTSVFPEFMVGEKPELDKNEIKSNGIGEGDAARKTNEGKMENCMMQEGGDGTAKGDSSTQLSWPQQQGFVSATSQTLSHPSQLLANQGVYTGQAPLRPGQPLLHSNQPVTQSYWPEQSRFAAPGYPPLSQPTLSTSMMSPESSGAAIQSTYFNSPGFCPYPGVAMNPSTNLSITSSPHLLGQNVPDFFRKRIRQGTQELNKLAEEIACTSAK